MTNHARSRMNRRINGFLAFEACIEIPAVLTINIFAFYVAQSFVVKLIFL